MPRLTLVSAATTLAAGALAVPFAIAAPEQVVVIHSAKLGDVLATAKGHLALYTWKQERDHRVHCTGACAKAWPPITVAKGTAVAMHVKGAMGVFGTIVRPDGRTQLTFDHQPVYTYHGDTATRILCNGVDGWFVVRA
jgi:predicted lipoprotein with Yx(FWY)xxD motif